MTDLDVTDRRIINRDGATRWLATRRASRDRDLEAITASRGAQGLARLIDAERAKPAPDRIWLESATRALAREVSTADQAAEVWTHGRRFTESPAFRQRAGLAVDPVAVPGFLEERQAMPDGMPQLITGRPAPEVAVVASRCTPYPLGRLSASYPRFTGQPAAEPHEPETVKAEGDLGLAIESTVIPYLSVWVPISRHAYDDLGVMQALVDNRLRRALGQAIDKSVAAALAADPGVPADDAADLAEAVRLATLDLGADGYNQPTVLASPADAAALHPADLPPGADLLASRALEAGTVIVADLGAAVLLASRGDAVVLVSDSDSDRFLRNELVLLAEAAVTPLITDPQAARRIGTAARTAAPAPPKSRRHAA
jgi:hypothetical protein